MKNLFIVVFVIFAFSFSAFAKLDFIPLNELVEESDLIIIGTLTEISESDENGVINGKGKIIVEKFITGNLTTSKGVVIESGDKLPLNYVESFSCVYGSHQRIENEKGIFFLTINENGEIKNETFRSLDDLAEIEKLLKKGVKPSKIAKTIKILNDFEQDSQVKDLETSVNESSENSFRAIKSKVKKEYYPFLAFLVILASMFLYRFLYRNRFKN